MDKSVPRVTVWHHEESHAMPNSAPWDRFFFFLIQFNVPFKIISLIETSQSIGGAKREHPGKTT